MPAIRTDADDNRRLALVDLSHNSIRHLSKLQNLHVDELRLDHNAIESIDDRTFAGCTLDRL